jgi:enamine deaminase RidA (YjgF/YER057c/UK114 family)
MASPEARLKELGIVLPQSPAPIAAYVRGIRTGNLVMTSGQLPFVEGRIVLTGAVGEGSVSIEDAVAQARICCINALAVVRDETGSLDNVKRVVRAVVYVQSLDNFHSQPLVANGASELLLEIFGDAGRHIRSAIGVNALPLNAPVELELTVEV